MTILMGVTTPMSDLAPDADSEPVEPLEFSASERMRRPDQRRDLSPDRRNPDRMRPLRTPPRYDGLAEWYDANIGPYAEAAGLELLALLGPGSGRCLDLACGSGINLRRLTDAGWSVTGVDISGDQLRLARRRAPQGVDLVQADAIQLPFEDASFDAVACSLLHTDVDDFAAILREAAGVLRPDGRLAYVGIHPCFVGPFARNPPAEPPELHPGYRNTAWTTEGFSDGIRRRAGARHVPLAELLNAFLAADLRLVRISEAGDEDFPTRIGILAKR